MIVNLESDSSLPDMFTNYFAPFREYSVRWAALALMGLLALTAAFTYLFQIASELPCSAECTWVAILGTMFWLGFLPQIMRYSDEELKGQSKLLNWCKLLGLGLGLVVLNQLFIRGAIALLFQLVYGCTGTMQSWLTAVLTNNILVNFLIYWGIVGLAFLTRYTLSSPPTTEIAVLETTPEPETLAQIWIKNGNKSLALPVQEIEWVEADNNCITIHTSRGRFVQYRSLRSLETELDATQFIRIHRSTLVNKSYVSEVQNLPGGDALAILRNGSTLRISRHLKGKQLLLC